MSGSCNFRLSKWHSIDFIIKLNSYITITNQGLNLLVFSVTYYVSLCKFFVLRVVIGLDIFEQGRSNSGFEKFHRRFLSFGFGSVFAYFLVKSMANIFCMGSRLTYEVLNREEGSGIPVDHPKNPATIINNISLAFFRSFQNCLEFNSLTNMGLCLFQVNPLPYKRTFS